MEVRKLNTNEITEAFKDRKKFKKIVIEAIEYLLNKKENTDFYIIGVREILQVVKEMFNLKNSEFDKKLSIKIGLALNDIGIETFNTGRGKEFIISKNEFEIIKHANK
jgi:hypothetical protein